MLRKNKIGDEKPISLRLPYGFLGLLLACSISLFSGCYLHSDEQEALAKDLQMRYGMIQPAGTTVLETLEEDLNQLLASRKADTDLLTEVSETAIVGRSWCQMVKETDTLRQSFQEKAARVGNGSAPAERPNPEQVKTALQNINNKIKALKEALKVTNTAISQLEKKRSLPQRLEETSKIINTTVAAINNVITTNPQDPLNKRVNASLQEIIDYLDGLKNNETKTEKTYSLLLESLRMGRDVTALQIESLEIDASYYERVDSIYTIQKELFKEAGFNYKSGTFVLRSNGQLVLLRRRFRERAGQCQADSEQNGAESEKRIVTHIQELADKGRSDNEAIRTQAELDLRVVLADLSSFQILGINARSRLDDLELRLSVEDYRRARLIDAVNERQRMVLISTGLDGIVRYSEGGWRSEDVGRIISIVGVVAQVVTAVRTN